MSDGRLYALHEDATLGWRMHVFTLRGDLLQTIDMSHYFDPCGRDDGYLAVTAMFAFEGKLLVLTEQRHSGTVEEGQTAHWIYTTRVFSLQGV